MDASACAGERIPELSDCRRQSHSQQCTEGGIMVWKWKRYVVGRNKDGKSAVLTDEATNVQENPGIFYRCTLWGTREVPVDNII